VIEPDGSTFNVAVTGACDAAGLEAADLVIVAVKTTVLDAISATIAKARAPSGLAIFGQNGLPWWYLRDTAGPWHAAVEPDASALGRHFAPGSFAAASLYVGGSVEAPGVVRRAGGFGVTIGQPSGPLNGMLDPALRMFRQAGFDASLVADPRPAIWSKLALNVALNGVAVVTGATIGAIFADPAAASVADRAVAEVQAIAAALGHETHVDLDAVRAQSGMTQKSSTLQDVEAGRAIEFKTMFEAPLAVARHAGVATPTLDVLVPLVRARALRAGSIPPLEGARAETTL
jgi:2-dehydropantoate 2-reductase